MSKLLVFGCSNTYGQGLPDCNWGWDEDMLPPSKMGWPHVVGNLLGREVVNYSFPGASVKETMFRVKQADISKDDMVIILWPHYSRTCIIKDLEHLQFDRLVAGNVFEDVEHTDTYFKYFYEEEDAWVTCGAMIDYTQMILNTVGVEHYFMFHKPWEIDRYRDMGIKNVLGLSQDWYFEKGGYSLTMCGHLDLDGNVVFGKDIYRFINSDMKEPMPVEWVRWFVDNTPRDHMTHEIRDGRRYHFYNHALHEVPFHMEFKQWLSKQLDKPEFDMECYHVHWWDDGDHFDEHTDNFKRRMFTYVCELQASNCGTGLVVEGVPVKEGVFATNKKHSVGEITHGPRISLTVFGYKPTSLL